MQWKTEHVTPGRCCFPSAPRVDVKFMMVVNGREWLLVCLDEGVVSSKYHNATELAQRLTEQDFEPASRW